jgi:hypothetical protein
MPEKKEGNTMTCNSCGTELICHMSSYKGNYKNQLQWQNEDGKAHYSTNNGKDFTCNVPKDDESQEVHTPESTVATNTSSKTSTTIESEIPQMDKVTEGYVDKQLILIQQIEKRAYEFLGKDARGDKVGMYVKLILEGINRK